MTLQRRPRRTPPAPDQQARLRALALDSSPTARRLRARVPRPALDPLPLAIPAPRSAAPPTAPSSSTAPGRAGEPVRAVARSSPGSGAEPPRADDARAGGGPPIPSAPYAVGVGSRVPYRPRPPRGGDRPAPGRHAGPRTPPGPWPDRDPQDTLTTPPEPPPTPPVLPACGRTAPSGGAGDGAPPRVPAAGDVEHSGWSASPWRESEDGPPEGAADVPEAGGTGSGGSSRRPGVADASGARDPGPPRRGGAGARAADADGLPRDTGETGQTGPRDADGERGRHRRAAPPSGYTEFPPGPPSAFLERLSQRWSPHATLSRRSVLTLIVVGVLAVTAVLVLHDRPTTVPAPEMVARSASAAASGAPGGDAAAGAEDAAEGGGAAGAEGGAAGAAPQAGPSGGPGADLVVHVGGEVEEPGLYTLPPDSRVADAVEEAGGALPDADLDLLNLARTLLDGEQILVGVPPPAGAAGTGTPGAGGAAGTGAPVDVNRADSALLETLPGVGPVIARNIVEYREAHGPFSSVEDLINVDRIGEKVLANLAPHATALS